nr:hypothetical protein [uncultured Flavobacterium sp.]
MGCEVSVLGVDKSATFVTFIPTSDGWGTLYYQNVFGAVCNCATKIEKDWGFKLLLRRVEDMTEEEKREFEQHMKWYRFTVDDFLNDLEVCETLHNYKTAATTINYLRSIHIDCDNLLSTEWAEHKTTTEQ